jgi:5'-deoxynucleotidase YfbR-like HD superfamily hydrolase
VKYRTYDSLRRAGLVTRLHTVPTVGPHTLARHVYGAQVMALALLARCPRADRGRVLEALLLHDAPEVDTGDIPAPLKRAHPLVQAAMNNLEREWYADHDIKLPVLSDLEQRIVKACDILDLGWACVEEVRLGNATRQMRLVFANVCEYLQEYIDVPGVVDLRETMCIEWEGLHE